jgi:alkanesulfonate monooxygenase SsuD/methylene tetrahydromethanopterin reductase-like flavin-dependent oxidoreductase (luciferase family)
MLGLPFPVTAERFERMEEIRRLADHIWNGEQGPFEGPFHRLERPALPRWPTARASSSEGWASGVRCRS